MAAFSQRHRVPVFVGGDVFDKARVSPETVNTAISVFKSFHRVYAIPGQHDLPYHNYEDRHNSSYGTLVAAEAVEDMKTGQAYPTAGPAEVFGFGWKQPITAPPAKSSFPVALVHRYVWHRSFRYPGAPEADSVDRTRRLLPGYKLAVFGDNHQPFVVRTAGRFGAESKRLTVVNCGAYAPRKADEQTLVPGFTVLGDDGNVYFSDYKTAYKWDKAALSQTVKEAGINLENLMSVLESVGEQTVDFEEAIYRYIKSYRINEQVAKILVSAMERP